MNIVPYGLYDKEVANSYQPSVHVPLYIRQGSFQFIPTFGSVHKASFKSRAHSGVGPSIAKIT